MFRSCSSPLLNSGWKITISTIAPYVIIDVNNYFMFFSWFFADRFCGKSLPLYIYYIRVPLTSFSGSALGESPAKATGSHAGKGNRNAGRIIILITSMNSYSPGSERAHRNGSETVQMAAHSFCIFQAFLQWYFSALKQYHNTVKTLQYHTSRIFIAAFESLFVLRSGRCFFVLLIS